MTRSLVAAVCLTLITAVRVIAQPATSEAPGIQVPDGFEVTLYADDDLAHDIHSLTIDTLGRIVVSGPGYIRILIDDNDDGRAESFQQFVDKPTTGSQGMCWLGRSLLCAGDEGLQVYRDENRDDKADDPPEVFLRIAAGGEHHVHSIQKGPDGWWYIIAGNFAGVNASYGNLPTSPLKEPVNGVLMRLKPDLFGGEILCDGMRNAYDFAITPTGDFFTYDSDDERDISLPWYLPTRVFHLLPMSSAGWVTAGWKRPESFADMPPVIGAFGRGSPTGVVCYQHDQFPEDYRGSLFVLDWTLGRILTLPLEDNEGGWKSTPATFATGRDQFGFAPTDCEIGPDGSLFVSVGGRGTRGGVFRIRHTASLLATTARMEKLRAADPLTRVLKAPQPGSSWSRATWTPLSRRLGAEAFRKAALEETRRAGERLRAIEVLVELFDGLDSPTAIKLTSAGPAPVRAKTAWAAGRTKPESPDTTVLKKLLADREALVQRFALEALATTTDETSFDQTLPQYAATLGSDNRIVRLTAAHLVSKLTPSQQDRVASLVESSPKASLWFQIGRQLRKRELNLPAAKAATSLVTGKDVSIERKREAVRLVQLALGDVGPASGRPAMFDSYAPRLPLAPADLELNPLRAQLADVFPTGDAELDHELIRVFAMTASLNRELFARILEGITPKSSPAEDIHRLAAIARFDIERSIEETTATAAGLVNIDVKIRQLGLKQDTNWDDRIRELFAALCKVDVALPHLIAEQPGLGEPGHTLFTGQIPQEAVSSAIEKFVAAIRADSDYHWTNDVVFFIGESAQPEHRLLLREQLENLSVRGAVLMVLAENPDNVDRALFVSGLESTQINAVDACVTALKKLPADNAPAEQFQLLSAARRLMNDTKEYSIREEVIGLLERNTGLRSKFVTGLDGYKPQPEVLQQWQIALSKLHPKYQPPDVSDAAKKTTTLLPSVAWKSGDAERGRRLFEKLSCAKCHGGRLSLGPDLTGVAKRFSREDLFAAIVEPNRDISPRYQTTSIETRAGRTYSGLIVYESVDGILLRDADHKTYRIEGPDIESRHAQRVSLMPAGLLKDLDATGLADLYKHLQSL